MSFYVAGAVVATGYMSSEASKDAADTGAEGARQAGQVTQAAADRARTDVNNLFPSAQRDFLAGQSGAFDIMGQGIGEQQRLLSGGNMNAQQTTGQGFGNVQNALLGLPVNQQNFAPQGLTMSQIPQNPISGQAVPALGAPTQPSSPLGGIFPGIKADTQSRDNETLSGIATNRDVIAALNSGAIDSSGMNMEWFDNLARSNPEWMGRNNMIEISKNTPENISEAFKNSGLNLENQESLRKLVLEIKRMRG